MVGEPALDPDVVAVRTDTLVCDGALYHVRLQGNVTPAWIRSYVSLWAGLAFFSRFDLDIGRREISFPATGGPESADTRSLVEIISAMLRLTTRRSRAA